MPDLPTGCLNTLSMMQRPCFSVLITAYNRADHIDRCVRSCSQQTFEDFEIVVVDDGSTDATVAVLTACEEPRLRIVRHPENRGISPARATAVEHARGEWLVMLDSDWELYPYTLARLRSLIDTLPPGVRIVRSRLQADDGHVDPGILPSGITDYNGRLRWLEALALESTSSDAGHCINRSVFETTNYFTDRRGAMETLWETDLARRERSLWVSDILGIQHTDASNSFTRGADSRALVARLRGEAPDALWMAEMMLIEHGQQLARYAPHYRRWLLRSATEHAFLAGDRLAGIRYSWLTLRAGAFGAQSLAVLGLGSLGPRPLAYVKLAGRRLRRFRHTMRTSKNQ